jgi:glycosyltransferase involved in cell wall biosynthesis
MHPKEISVVVPLYKGADFVEAALESVCAQTFEDWECICVDDGSVDGTGRIAEGLAAKDDRIRVIRQANGGTSAARNKALSMAGGRYIAFLDEDDLFHPRCLEVLHDLAVRHGADVVGMDFVPFEEGSAPGFRDPPPAGSETVHDAVSMRELVSRWYDGAPWEVWRHLYRREIAAEVEFPKGVRIEQDLMWHYAILPRLAKYVRIPWAGYGWRRNSNGGVLNPRAEDLVSEVRSFAFLAGSIPRRMGFSDEQKRLFFKGMAVWCKSAVVAPVRGGVDFSHDEFAAFKTAVAGLGAAGVDLRCALGLRKRLLWNLFMATGLEVFMRL